MAGILSGVVIRRVDMIKRSQFMKFIYKGVLRDSVKNLIAFNSYGNVCEVDVFNGLK